MNEILFTVGVPASGKSTWCNEMKSKGYIIHSSDKLREELYGDESIQGDNNLLFQELHKRIKFDLSQGNNVIYDATNINRKRRISFLKELNKIQCKRIAIVFTTPYEICVKQDLQRNRTVGESVIKRMYMSWNTPVMGEGFDEIRLIHHNTYNNQIRDLFDKMINFDQENHHHKLTLDKHCIEAYKYICDKTNDEILQISALIHDCGKPFTKNFKNSKGELTNEAHYFNHNCTGAYDVLSMRYDYTDEELLRLSTLIEFHMHPYLSWKQSQKSVNRDKQILGINTYKDIILLHEADLYAH